MHSSRAPQASTASRAQRFVTIAKRPLRAQDARRSARDLPVVTSKSACDTLARRANHARRRIPEHESQEPGHEPVIQCGRCVSALARIPDPNPISREVRKAAKQLHRACRSLKQKAARRRLLNSNLMIVDQRRLSIKACLNLRRRDAPQQDGYFNEELIELNMVFRLLPSPLTTAMIASAIPAAISPYSIAVAPDSSDMNSKRLYFKLAPLRLCVCENSNHVNLRIQHLRLSKYGLPNFRGISFLIVS